MTQAQHPEELLAEYVEGTLGPDDRARVDSHLSACASCREEVALAGSSMRTLGSLPELDVPAGTTWPVVQRAKQRRGWLPALSPRVALAAAGAAVVLFAAVMGVSMLVQNRDVTGTAARSGPDAAGAPEETAENAMQGGTAEFSSYPTFRRSTEDYDNASLGTLARALTDQARTALDRGFPEPPARFYARTAVLAKDESTLQALSCVATAVAPDRSLAPFAVVAARFEGEPAYIGAFLQANRPDQPYRQLAVYVVSRDGCALRSFARQQL